MKVTDLPSAFERHRDLDYSSEKQKLLIQLELVGLGGPAAAPTWDMSQQISHYLPRIMQNKGNDKMTKAGFHHQRHIKKEILKQCA